MTTARSLALPRVVATVAALTLATLGACGSDDDDPTTTVSDPTETSESTAPSGGTTGSPTSDPSGGGTAGPFVLTTDNDDIRVSGNSQAGCTNPDETTLEVSFTDGTLVVQVSAEDGEGTVIVPGFFEGTIDSIQVGDLGDVFISGRGSLADDTAEPTTFDVTGSCA